MTGKPVRDTQRMYDVVIVGATPAGSAAAVHAPQMGLRALVVEAASFPRKRGQLDWLGPAAIELCRTCGLNAKAARAGEFTGLRLHSWDLKRSSRVSGPEMTGWIVDRAVFDQALWKVARQRGAHAIFGAEPKDLLLGEECVRLSLQDGREICGRTLLIADGASSPTASLARLPTAGQARSIAACAEVAFETKPGEVGLDVIIGPRRAPQMVTVLRASGRTRVSLVTRESQPSVEDQLGEFLAAARAAKLIPDRDAQAPLCSVIPAGVALDVETHVGKRCLLTGEAGGFVSAFSAETIYPSMKSGWIATEAVAGALRAPVLQDELLSFSSAWRADFADYLRLPNTDLALLMPLVFSNAQMSGRVARAFLLGQGF